MAVRKITKRSLAKDKFSKTEGVSRRTNVILEDIDSKFQQVLEGHGALDKKIDGLHDEFNDFKTETRIHFKALTERMGNFEEKTDANFGAITGRIGNFEEKTDANFKVIREYLSHIDDEIQDLKRSLSKKADLKRLEQLEQRIARVELVVKKYYEQS